MNLIVTGDFVINRPYSGSNISKEVIDLFKESDWSIVNLEAPVTSSSSEIAKTGPHLKSDAISTQEVLKTLKTKIVTLANNHVLDYDEQGVKDTLEFCCRNDILSVGAGMDLKEASKILYINSKEGKLGILNFAENEWTCATEASAGANPMDIIDNTKQIKEAKENADFVFVIVHGGNEYNHYPSPRMVKQYRYYAEMGADAVIGHHTHCISGFEKHNDVPIFYSLGNFLFTTEQQKLDNWYFGLAVKFKLQKGKKVEFDVTILKQRKECHSLSLAQKEDRKAALDIINDVNKVIVDEELLEAKWETFVQEVQNSYVKHIFPIGGIKNRYLKGAIVRMKLVNLFLNQTYIKEHLNRVRCEAHNDVTKTILTKYVKKT